MGDICTQHVPCVHKVILFWFFTYRNFTVPYVTCTYWCEVWLPGGDQCYNSWGNRIGIGRSVILIAYHIYSRMIVKKIFNRYIVCTEWSKVCGLCWYYRFGFVILFSIANKRLIRINFHVVASFVSERWRLLPTD